MLKGTKENNNCYRFGENKRTAQFYANCFRKTKITERRRRGYTT